MGAGACVGAGGRGGVAFCLHVWESVVSAGRRVWGWRRCCSRLPVNNARGECFMARAGL